MFRKRIALFLIPAMILTGLGTFFWRYAREHEAWAMSVYNRGIYTAGELSVGNIYDRNGIMLSKMEDGVRKFAKDELTRLSTAHATGDVKGNIGTGALKAFASELAGYNIFTGTKSDSNMYLTIDSELNKVAYSALGGYSGTVAVCNYETGEIICMVSTPSCDPEVPGDAQGEGVYMNRFLSASYTPGSVFKIVTLIAAMENIPDLAEQEFTCNGSITLDGEQVNCHSVHGVLKIEDAFAYSCNCAFAEIALQLGTETLAEYAEKLGLTSSFEIDGITTVAGSFTKAENDMNTAWSGIGQYMDLVNPAAMLRLVAAIANDGTAPALSLILERGNPILNFFDFLKPEDSGEQLLDSELSAEIAAMMDYNVYANYGDGNFPGLELCAKSGTAEVGSDKAPHSWFVGFITNEDHPLAFVVVAENGGSGASTAGRIANTVLQSAVAVQE